MVKFLFTRAVFMLYFGYLNFPTFVPDTCIQKSKVVFPIKEQVKLAEAYSKLTQKEIAYQLSMSVYNLEAIEKGLKRPSEAETLKLENILNFKIDKQK
jgi:ribosome-binding protein aMBF1 (putative translation factor)